MLYFLEGGGGVSTKRLLHRVVKASMVYLAKEVCDPAITGRELDSYLQ